MFYCLNTALTLSQFPRIAQGFTRYKVAHFFQTYPRVIKPLTNLTLLLVVTGAAYMTQLACSKFVGLQTFESFKGREKGDFFQKFRN